MTPSATDTELLSAYLHGSEEAFRALADRYIGLIYATACRAAGPEMAEDVTQAVFILLAQRARSIRDPQFLPAWLLKVTRYCAADARRGAHRRRKHEQRAAAMAAPLTTDGRPDASELLYLDAALQALSPSDRTTILLRFFREQSLAQVAISLEISEQAAKKRLARALERLRRRFLRKGDPLAAPVLATALAASLARQASAAPPALATKICGIALSKSAATTTAALIAKGAFKLMAYTTVKWTAAAAAVLIVTAATAVAISHRAPPPAPTPLVSIALPAPATASAPAIATIAHDPDPTIEIRDMATKQPIEGVQIELSSDHVGSISPPTTTGITNANGTVSIPLPATISDRLEISAHKDSYVAAETVATRLFPGDTLPATFSLQLEKATTIGGRVLDEQGLPLESALVNVTFFGKQYKGLSQSIVGNLRTTTNARGEWSLNAAPEQCDKIYVGAFHKSCVSGGLIDGGMSTSIASIPELRKGTAVLTLTRGTPIHALLRGPDGKPVRGWIGISDMRSAATVVPEIPTTDHGQFDLVPSLDQPFYFMARADGCASRIVELKATDPQPLIIALQPATPLNARIVDPSGHPVANAILTPDYYNSGDLRMGGMVKLLISDQDGRISWPESFNETQYATIRARGYMQQSNIPIAPGQPNVITMLPRFVIHGSVVDDETHQAAREFQVVEGNYLTPDHTSIRYTDYAEWESSHIRRTGPGRFDFTDADEHDQFLLGVFGGEYEPTDSPNIITDGHDQSITIHLHKGQAIAGTLLDITGKPLPKTQVYLQTIWMDIYDGVLPRQPTVQPGYDNSAYFSLTDAQGQFSFPARKVKPVLMVSTDAGYALTRFDTFQGNNNVLQLLPWAKLEGTVIKDGKPVPNSPVTGAFMADDILDNEIGPGCHFTDKTDKDGHFTFPKIFVGPIIISGDSSFKKTSTVYTYPGETSKVTIGTDIP